jgi:ubiquinone biosynthesis protein UbiJ
VTPPAVLLGAAEQMLNRALAADPHSLRRLAALKGSLHLRHSDWGWELGVIPVAQGLILSEPEEAPRAKVSLSNQAIMALLRKPSAGRAVPGMQIEGDAGFLQEVADIVQGLEVDLAGLLQPWLGSSAAPAAMGLQRVGAFLKRGLQQLETQTVEYLSEESRDLVPPLELDDWMQQVDDLAMDVDRLQARLQRLERAQ